MNQNKLISVVTVNYNGFEETCNFIDSWEKHIKSVNYEIIIVDNGSKTDESILLKNKYPDIITIRSERNLGFAGANNLGVLNTKGDLVFFLNNDVLIIDDNLEQFASYLEASSKIAGISPLILNNDANKTIQYGGYTSLNSITLRNRAINERSANYSISKPVKTEFLHGAAMLIKKEAMEDAGPMDEEYFLYYEEMDWCMKFKKRGYELWMVPTFKIVHNNSSTIGLDNPLKTYYITRNRLLFAYKNYSKYQLFLITLYHIFVAYPYHIVKYII